MEAIVSAGKMIHNGKDGVAFTFATACIETLTRSSDDGDLMWMAALGIFEMQSIYWQLMIEIFINKIKLILYKNCFPFFIHFFSKELCIQICFLKYFKKSEKYYIFLQL